MPKHALAIALHMLVEPDARVSFGQHARKRGLADQKRIAPQVVAVQLDQVERVEEYVANIAPIANVVEGCDTIIVADDCLAVDDARPAA